MEGHGGSVVAFVEPNGVVCEEDVVTAAVHPEAPAFPWPGHDGAVVAEVVGVAVVVGDFGGAGGRGIEAELGFVAGDDEVAGQLDLVKSHGAAAAFTGPLGGEEIVAHGDGAGEGG